MLRLHVTVAVCVSVSVCVCVYVCAFLSYLNSICSVEVCKSIELFWKFNHCLSTLSPLSLSLHCVVDCVQTLFEFYFNFSNDRFMVSINNIWYAFLRSNLTISLHFCVCLASYTFIEYSIVVVAVVLLFLSFSLSFPVFFYSFLLVETFVHRRL